VDTGSAAHHLREERRAAQHPGNEFPHPDEERPVGRVSKDAYHGASWFETAQVRLLTMRCFIRRRPTNPGSPYVDFEELVNTRRSVRGFGD
jgi:hypothetical protein